MRVHALLVATVALACNADNGRYDGAGGNDGTGAGTGGVGSGSTSPPSMTDSSSSGDGMNGSGMPDPMACNADFYGINAAGDLYLLDVLQGEYRQVALERPLQSQAIATGPDGLLYISDLMNGSRLWRVEPMSFQLGADVDLPPGQPVFRRAMFVGNTLLLGPDQGIYIAVEGPDGLDGPVAVVPGPPHTAGNGGDGIHIQGMGPDSVGTFDMQGRIAFTMLGGGDPASAMPVAGLQEQPITGAAFDREGRPWVSLESANTRMVRLAFQEGTLVATNQSFTFEGFRIDDLAPIRVLPEGC